MATKRFFCIDAHTCGNPVRLVAGGGPLLKGKDMGEKRLHFLKEYDWIRKGLMFEPRGHDLMSGSILYPPSDSSNDIGILFIETSGCLPMCGHGTIGTVTIMIEEGLVRPQKEGFLRLETPAGLVEAIASRWALLCLLYPGFHVIAVFLQKKKSPSPRWGIPFGLAELWR